MCRRGFYQYEHINPTFENATAHDPEHICCLCASCHDAVTRGQFSKDAVSAAYRHVQSLTSEQAQPPIGPLDFHDGSAQLLIGGLLYSPAVHTVLRYHGEDLIRVAPATNDEPASISALFMDDSGAVTLRLIENEWIGALDAWDTEIIGNRLTVRQKPGRVSLQLRLDPPGRIVVERLDMRFRSAHVLATAATYAVGRYLRDGTLNWVHAGIRIERSSPMGTAIEFTDSRTLAAREALLGGVGAELADEARDIVLNAHMGVVIKPWGIVIGGLSGAFSLTELAIGNQPLEDVRRVIASEPDNLCRFIATRRTVDEGGQPPQAGEWPVASPKNKIKFPPYDMGEPRVDIDGRDELLDALDGS